LSIKIKTNYKNYKSNPALQYFGATQRTYFSTVPPGWCMTQLHRLPGRPTGRESRSAVVETAASISLAEKTRKRKKI